jgi:hypothetical protein
MCDEVLATKNAPLRGLVDCGERGIFTRSLTPPRAGSIQQGALRAFHFCRQSLPQARLFRSFHQKCPSAGLIDCGERGIRVVIIND